ncbi:MAG: O-antigen ligase family protein [Robiginitomaculum sp.]
MQGINTLSGFGSTCGWAQKKNTFFVFLIAVFVPIAAYAGGLGIAALLGLGGLQAIIGLRREYIVAPVRHIPISFWALFVFLLWGLISTLWSPYKSPETLSNPIKIFLGVPLYLGFAALVLTYVRRFGGQKLFVLITGFCFFSAILYLIDFSTGFSFTRFLDPVEQGADPNIKFGNTVQNLGHGVVVLLLISFPVMGRLWSIGGAGKTAAIFLAILVLFCGKLGEVDACIVALILGFGAMGITALRPKFGLWLSFTIAIFTIAFAPLIAFIATKLSPEVKAHLPWSWEERVDNWAFLYTKILNHPLFGNGFDAVRTYNETHDSRGYDKAIVSLHPHNGGIHIWLELGAIGALLACIALYFSARALTAPGRLSREQTIVVSGFVIAVALIANISFGVWQDWWWASIIYAGSLIAMVRPKNYRK